jgi:hypothetical protein
MALRCRERAPSTASELVFASWTKIADNNNRLEQQPQPMSQSHVIAILRRTGS